MTLMPVRSVPRYKTAIVTSFRGIERLEDGGDRGKVIFVWPWQHVVLVYQGYVSREVFVGAQRLHFRNGSWADFEKAYAITRIVDPVKALYDVRYEDEGRLRTGLDAASRLMMANVGEALRSFVATKPMQEAVVLTGPEAQERLNLMVPTALNPDFAGITSATGIDVPYIRLSDVKPSENFTSTMEDIALTGERQKAARRELESVLDFVEKLKRSEGEGATLESAIKRYKEINAA